MQKQPPEQSSTFVSVANVGEPVPSRMLTNARRNVSECFPDVTGITSCTIELIHDTRTEIERHGVLHTELNVSFGDIFYSKILVRGPGSYPTGFLEHGESLIQDGGFWLPAFSGASSLSLSNFAQIWCPCVSVVVTIISITKCLSCVTSHLFFCLANDLLTSVPG